MQTERLLLPRAEALVVQLGQPQDTQVMLRTSQQCIKPAASLTAACCSAAADVLLYAAAAAAAAAAKLQQ